MSGPWERYSAPQESRAPWKKYEVPGVTVPAPTSKATNMLDALIRGTAAGTSLNFADELAAAGNAAIPAIGDLSYGKEYASRAPTFSQRYDENIQKERAIDAANAKEYPLTSLTGNLLGALLLGKLSGVRAPTTATQAGVQGAAIGGAYGFGEGEGGLLGRIKSTAIDGALGGLTAAGMFGLSNLISPYLSKAVKTLRNEGVTPTVGQTLGGPMARIEEGVTSIPLVGDPIKEAQARAVGSLNKAAYNRVLEPFGLKYPEDAPIGNEGIKRVNSVIRDAYDHAWDGAFIKDSPDLRSSIGSVLDEASFSLPPERVNIIQKNIDRLITSKLDQHGELDQKSLQLAKNWFAEQARKGGSMDEQNLASAYNGILGTLKNAVGEADPERGLLLNAADKAYANFVRVANAASSNNASGREGLFSAAQLGSAARAADNSVRKLDFARGDALMQDLAQAGQQVLGPKVPDSGTPFRWMVEHPLQTLALSPGWLATKMVYSEPGQKALNTVVTGAPETRQAIAQQMRRTIPLMSMLPLTFQSQGEQQ